MTLIHPTAIVNMTARIADDVSIGPYTIVDSEVEIGPGCLIGGHVTLGERLTLGRGVQVFNYACVGTASQDLKHDGERSFTEIGDGAIIREFVTVNRGSKEGGVTSVGAGAVLLAYSHVAHECLVGDGALLVNAATLGGEVQIGRGAVIGGMAGVHQFCRIGDYSIVGGLSKVTQDIPPFLTADGHPARPYGPNKVGLERAGFTPEQIEEVRAIYRIVFDRGEAMEANLARLAGSMAGSALASHAAEFCRKSMAEGGRGISRPRSGPRAPEIDDFSNKNGCA